MGPSSGGIKVLLVLCGLHTERWSYAIGGNKRKLRLFCKLHSLGFQVVTMIPCTWHSQTKINTVRHVTVRRSFNGRCRFHILTQCLSKVLLNYLALQLNKVISTIQNSCFSYHSSSSNYLDFFFRSHTNIYFNMFSIVDRFHIILVWGRSLFVAGEGWGFVGFRFRRGNIYLVSLPPPPTRLCNIINSHPHLPHWQSISCSLLLCSVSYDWFPLPPWR